MELHQFEFSHFNEKARWALDYKGISHTRNSYLPGPHIPAIKKITGQTQTPVLQIEGDFTPGSAEIIARLEQLHPTPSLYPANDDDLTRALALQTELDEQLGPAARTVIFSGLINEPDYLVSMFGKSKGLLKRTLYRATYPMAKRLMAQGNGVDNQANIDHSFASVQAWLDRIQGELGENDYLVANQFSVADLTAASLLAPIANVSHPDMARPKPIPSSVQQIIDGFIEHPTIQWVQTIYERHRPAV